MVSLLIAELGLFDGTAKSKRPSTLTTSRVEKDEREPRTSVFTVEATAGDSPRARKPSTPRGGAGATKEREQSLAITRCFFCGQGLPQRTALNTEFNVVRLKVEPCGEEMLPMETTTDCISKAVGLLVESTKNDEEVRHVRPGATIQGARRAATPARYHCPVRNRAGTGRRQALDKVNRNDGLVGEVNEATVARAPM